MATVVGVFRHSGDAHLAGEHLLEEFALTDQELDVIGPGDTDRLVRPEPGVGDLALMTYLALPPGGVVGENPVASRWGDQVRLYERTLVVARTFDEEMAEEMARELRRAGADRVDIITA